MDIMQLLIGLEILSGILLVAMVPAMKFIIFFWKLLFLKRKHRGNIGLVFERSVGYNFSLPRIVPIIDPIENRKDKINVYSREMFQEGTFFGSPFLFIDTEDMKTTLGLYKHQCDADGKPAYHAIPTNEQNEKGEQIYMQTKIPILDARKTSVSVQPGLLKTAVVSVALGEALKEFFKKYKIVLILVGVSALAAGVAAFFAYNNQNAISQLCQVNFNDLKQATMTCIEVAKNATEVIKK